MLATRLNYWKSIHGIFPENVIIYRDGVSEGQYQQVLKVELEAMQGVCAKMYAEANANPPKFTLIVVGKRHHPRCYPSDSKSAHRNGNPRNGTLVDRHVTEARTWDFFLQSHHAIQGTARPAHYIVLWDEIFSAFTLTGKAPYSNAAELLHYLTHNLCYLFGRATCAVSIPPPVYYADLACDRTRRYLRRDYEGLVLERSPDEETIEQKAARQQKLRDRMQQDITIHESLRDTMFYI